MTDAIVDAPSAVKSEVPAPRRITVVDDSHEFVELLEEALGRTYLVQGCEPAVEVITATRPDVVILDPWRPHDPNWHRALVRAIRARAAFARLPIITCSAIRPLGGAADGSNDLEPVFHLQMPFALAELENVLEAAISRLDRSGPA